MALRYIFIAANALRLVASQDCNCYLSNGSTPSYFTSHQFYDFRNVPSAQIVVPAVPTTAARAHAASEASAYFTSSTWSDQWDIQTWNNSDMAGDASVLMVNSKSNVYIENAESSTNSYRSHLTLRTNRQPDFQSVSEIDSIAQNYHYVSARWYARVIGSPGACAGLFTYRDPSTSSSNTVKGHSPTANLQEADIEILTKDPRASVQFTNQPSVSASGDTLVQATSNSTIPDDLDWSQWNTYRLDWTKGKSEWYVNGERTSEIEFQAPKDPAGLILNMWSDGGSWTGNMSVNEYAYLQVQWMEVLYNTSGPVTGSKIKRDDEKSDLYAAERLNKRVILEEKGWRNQKRAERGGCKAVCGVDQNSSTIGKPALLVDNSAAWSIHADRHSRVLVSVAVTLILAMILT